MLSHFFIEIWEVDEAPPKSSVRAEGRSRRSLRYLEGWAVGRLHDVLQSQGVPPVDLAQERFSVVLRVLCGLSCRTRRSADWTKFNPNFDFVQSAAARRIGQSISRIGQR